MGDEIHEKKLKLQPILSEDLTRGERGAAAAAAVSVRAWRGGPAAAARQRGIAPQTSTLFGPYYSASTPGVMIRSSGPDGATLAASWRHETRRYSVEHNAAVAGAMKKIRFVKYFQCGSNPA